MNLHKLITIAAMNAGLLLNPFSAFAQLELPKNSKQVPTIFSQKQTEQIKVIVKDYLLQNPEILLEVSKALQKKQQDSMMSQAAMTIEQNANEIFNNKNVPFAGNSKGDVTIVEFFDYQCVHCKKMAPVLGGLLSKHQNLKVTYFDFPIFGKSSDFAAEAVLAAQLQGKYHALHDALINKSERLTPAIVLKTADEVGINTTKLKADMKSEAVQKALLANRQLAGKLKLMGTPAFIVASTPNGTFAKGSQTFFIPGAASEESLDELIDQAGSINSKEHK